ncbi:MAG TPA: hypothetical protein VMU08_08430 [Rhizomicrobium sp.]|nr:hypothetical protein [Rhizomicrobium sp.]
MRRTALILLACGAALAAGPACAAEFVIPDANSPLGYRTYATRPADDPWMHPRHVPSLAEAPVVNLLAEKLGLAEGRAEIFRYQVEDAPSNKTVLDGAIAGGGIRLRLSW